jgi:hypothetical protein
MPVTLAYCINVLLTLFSDVCQDIANILSGRLTHFALFSFVFNGKYKGTLAENTARW